MQMELVSKNPENSRYFSVPFPEFLRNWFWQHLVYRNEFSFKVIFSLTTVFPQGSL